MKIRLALVSLALCSSPTGSTGTGVSPVTRIVSLLENLHKKVEEDHKREEALFKKYSCWAQKIVGEKTMSNEKAQTRKDSLDAYIADLDAGRIELTSERVDLEKEISGLQQDVQIAEEMRTKEHEDYLAAKDELTKAKVALTDAIAILEEATKGSGSLLTLRSRLNSEGLEQRLARGEALARAIEVGRRFLSRGDSEFLQKLLTGDVPSPDWEKLNRKADFKMKYKARSGKIQETLSSLLATFTAGLEDVEKKESGALDIHQKLTTSKKDQLTKAQDALSKMEVEGAARGLSKSEAQAEVQALATQIQDDKGFMQQTEDALKVKTQEWKERQKVRMDELAAISQATAILHGDDARDLFKRSLKSQGYSFVQAQARQRERTARAAAQRQSASGILHSAARAAGDHRLVALAASAAAASPSHFAVVVTKIEEMLAALLAEESADLETKEKCEKTRGEDTRSAAKTARLIDDSTDKIVRLEQEVAELAAQIEGKNESIAQIQTELAEAKEIREAENAEWVKSNKDDLDAAQLVADAVKVLEAFYTAQGGGGQAFVQQEPVAVEAGKAPPPPPATWDAPYAGKQDENKGILAILALVKEDIEADRQRAKTAEDAAAQTYTKLETESTSEIGTLQASMSELSGTKGQKEAEAVAEKQGRLTSKGSLDAVMKKIETAEPGCHFFTVNFVARRTNRQIEVDGLQKAKAILSGATFPTAADPSRELKPGDAFLQEVNRHL